MGSVDKPLPSETYGEPLGDLPTLWGAFASHAAKTPDALALVCTHQAPGLLGLANLMPDDDKDDDDRYLVRPYLRWSYRTLHDAILRLVASLRALGVREGATLVMFVQNGAEHVLATWAAIAMGCNAMPISPRNLTNVDEATHMVKTGLGISPGIKPVVLVGNEQLATTVDDLGVLGEAFKISVAAEPSTSNTDWISFQSLMELTSDFQLPSEDVPEILGSAPNDRETGGSIIFTSGTTSLPKGLYHPYQTNMGRILPHRYQREGFGNFGPGSRLACNLPNNHAMGWLCLVGSFVSGAALILPGLAFEPTLMLETIFDERVTHTMLVPTMIHALVAVKAASPKFRDRPLTSMENIMLGGMILTTADVDLITSTLGVRGFEHFYGCSEGLLVSSQWTGDAQQLASGSDVSAGVPMIGFRLRVIDPATGEVVPRGVLGELHGSGPSLLGGYIGGLGKDAWYTDSDGTCWYKTGDQARMDEKGMLFITGRYKDMIVRGGENISPSAVEAVLARNKLINPLIPQIVGAKDVIAGEVPVAVVKGKVTPEIRDAIRSEVVAHMGALYVPEDVISTEDLGLADYPRTTSGKIQKSKLTALVNQHVAHSENGDSNGGHKTLVDGQLTDTVRKIWARAVGLDPSHIQVDAPMSEFADSITIMRVREGIRRQTGRALSLQDMLAAGTIRRQTEMLLIKEAPGVEGKRATVQRPSRQGPPELEDMVHLVEDPELLQSTKKLVTETIAEYGLGWDDVEDVIPAYDFNAVMSQTKLNEDWTWHFAIQAVAKVGRVQLRRALEAVTMNNRILASFMAWNPDALGSEVALHVVMKQTPAFFDIMMEDGGTLATLSALAEVPDNLPRPDWVTFPGPLNRAILFDVEETGGAGLVMSANHAVIDASFAHVIQEDLDRALAVVIKSPAASSADILAQLQPHVDYKPWADLHFNLRTSAEARAATKWHVKRLRFLAEHVKAGALFPAKGPTIPAERRLAAGLDPVRFSFDIPDIHRLRREHPHITAAVVVKAAVALMNVQHTGCAAAVFGNLEAARRHFPFLPKATLEHAGGQFEATDVSGPAYQMVFNVVEVDRSAEETVLAFLGRMQEDQKLLTKYSNVPLREVMEGLDKASPGAGDMLPKIIDTQHFNWVPGLGTTGTDEYQRVKMLAAVNRPTIGLVVAAGLGGKENQTVFLNLYGDGEYVGKDEATRLGKQVQAITKWLATSRNWAAPVSGFPASFESL